MARDVPRGFAVLGRTVGERSRYGQATENVRASSERTEWARRGVQVRGWE